MIILLDQLPRNAFRDTAHMFATDPLAVAFAKEAIQRGHDREVAPELRPFILMPLMHSESLEDQEQLLTLLDEATEARVTAAVLDRIHGLARLQPLLDDPQIRDIHISGAQRRVSSAMRRR